MSTTTEEGYTFEEFTRSKARAGDYGISYNGKGSFGLLSGFYTKENIKDFKKVQLFFDKNKMAIAMRFTNDENASNAFAVIHAKNQSTGSISARSFSKLNDLNNEELRGKKKPRLLQDPNFGDLFVIDLKPKVPAEQEA